MNKILALLLLFFMPFQVLAYSSPGRPTGYVNDFAGILSTETKQQLEQKLSSLDASTSAQISVVSVKNLSGDTIENFAVKLFEEWQIGQKGKDNGILLLVAVEDRKVRIEVGYGLEGAVTDAETSKIIRDVITPAFKENDYNRGILEGVSSILSAASEDLAPTSEPMSGPPEAIFDMVWNALFFGIPLFIWLVSIMARSRSVWLGGIVGGVGGLIFAGMGGLLGFGLLGLFIDWMVSSEYKKSNSTGVYPWWIGGRSGFGGGSSGGSRGFGGFGGGRSGGGGSSGSW